MREEQSEIEYDKYLYSKLEGQHRMYYSDKWHCDCEQHTIEGDLKALENIFYDKYANIKVDHDKDTGNYYVNNCSSCILEVSIRTAEFHGLMLQSIHAEHHGQFTGLGFIFKRAQYWREQQ